MNNLRKRVILESPTVTTNIYVMHSNGSIEKVKVKGDPSITKINYANENPTGDCIATNVSSSDIGIILRDSELDTTFMLTADSNSYKQDLPWYYINGTYAGYKTGGSVARVISSGYDRYSLHYGLTVNGAYDSRSNFKQGYTGVANTDNIAAAATAAGGTQTQCAALYCKNQTKTLPSGQVANGYLPSMAEFVVAADNYYAVNAALTALGGKMIHGSAFGESTSWFWTSTENTTDDEYAIFFACGTAKYSQPIFQAEPKNITSPHAGAHAGAIVFYDVKGKVSLP